MGSLAVAKLDLDSANGRFILFQAQVVKYGGSMVDSLRSPVNNDPCIKIAQFLQYPLPFKGSLYSIQKRNSDHHIICFETR